MENIEMADNESGSSNGIAGLPHGRNFRFIDRIIELSPGTFGKGEWDVKRDECFFPGHFPGNPLVPGVIMIEALAQLAGIVAASTADSEVPGYLLTAVRSVKITGTVSPETTLLIHVNIIGRMGGMVQAGGTVSDGGKELAKGEIILSSTGGS